MKPLHLAALLLAIVNAIAGISLLLLSGWFIAASALAGLSAAAISFNYLVPAASIRFLALTRIASGYGEKAVGHHSLLERLHQLRLLWFKQVMAQGGSETLRAEQAEHLNQSVEDSANRWLSVIHPNWANLFIAGIAAALLTWLTPFALPLWLTVLAVSSGLWLLIYAKQKKAEQAKQFAQQKARSTLEHQLQGAPLWLLSPKLEQGESLFSSLSHWLKLLAKQRVIEAQGEALLVLLSGLALVASLWLLPLPWYGQALIMLPVTLLLAMPEWLGNSFRAIKPLLGAQRAKQTLGSIESASAEEYEHCKLPPANQITLQGYCWQRGKNAGQALSGQFDKSELVWLKGSSGSGKSSLLQALVGLTGEQGLAQLDDHSLSAVPVKQRQQQMLYIEQFPYVLADTLANNLKLARPDATDSQLREALQFAGLEALSEQLESWVGESGRALSGGEMKRLGLARAWLKQAPIWLLDEPFEGVDPQRQKELLVKLRQHASDKLIIIASHLWPDGVKPDQVVDLDKKQAS